MVFILQFFRLQWCLNVIYVRQQRGSSGFSIMEMSYSNITHDSVLACFIPISIIFGLSINILFVAAHTQISSMQMTSVHFHRDTNQFNCLQVTKYLDAPHSKEMHIKWNRNNDFYLPFNSSSMLMHLDLCHIKWDLINLFQFLPFWFEWILLIKKSSIYELNFIHWDLWVLYLKDDTKRGLR